MPRLMGIYKGFLEHSNAINWKKTKVRIYWLIQFEGKCGFSLQISYICAAIFMSNSSLAAVMIFTEVPHTNNSYHTRRSDTWSEALQFCGKLSKLVADQGRFSSCHGETTVTLCKQSKGPDCASCLVCSMEWNERVSSNLDEPRSPLAGKMINVVSTIIKLLA